VPAGSELLRLHVADAEAELQLRASTSSSPAPRHSATVVRGTKPSLTKGLAVPEIDPEGLSRLRFIDRRRGKSGFGKVGFAQPVR